MSEYIKLGRYYIPTYGLIVLLGFTVCMSLAQSKLKNDSKRRQEFFSIVLFSGIGALIGSKTLTVIFELAHHSVNKIDFVTFKDAGYSFYGGLAGFFGSGFIFCKIFKIDSGFFVENFLFVIPLMHCIWKIGCLMGGCCFGIEYSGPMAVVFPSGVNNLSGVQVFPIQILESAVSFITSIFLYFYQKRSNICSPTGLYFLIYGISRFFLEFLRFHERESFLSDGQICSIICVLIGIIIINSRERNKYE